MLVILSYVGGYMNIREYIKEEGRQEGEQKGMLAGMQKGKLEGKEEGRQEKERQVIANMFQKNLNVSLIADVTGLSEKEIKKLQKNTRK